MAGGREPSADERAAAVAAAQLGAVSLRQAVESGLTDAQVRHRVRTGRWLIAARGVFVVAGTPEFPDRPAMVACLAGPAGTVASHLSAAAALRLTAVPPQPHITVPETASARCRAAIVHRSNLSPEDRTVVGGLPCTHPARTLVDCAGLVDYDALCDMVDEVLCRAITQPARVLGAMARAGRRPGRKGLAALARALEVWTPGAPPGSPREMQLARRLLDWGFPRPERQVRILDGSGHLVAVADLGYSPAKVVLEYDGERHHGPRQAHWDALRQADVEALGWAVIRVRKADLRPGATRVRHALAHALGGAPPRKVA